MAQVEGLSTQRNRDRSYFRASVLQSNERALERGLITLRQYLVACSRLMDVGVGIVVDDVPEAAEEVVIDLEQAPQLEPEVVIEEMIPLEPLPAPVAVAAQDAVAPAPKARARSRCPAPAVLCGVCRENTPSHVLLRCGYALCSDCLTQLERHDDHRCPFCRAFIERANPSYLDVY